MRPLPKTVNEANDLPDKKNYFNRGAGRKVKLTRTDLEILEAMNKAGLFNQ